jgi:diguanylate cyclase (GGDEF)-like protein
VAETSITRTKEDEGSDESSLKQAGGIDHPSVPTSSEETGEVTSGSSGLESRPRILVVDDEPGVRQVIRVNLVMQGHEVVEAKNGAQALKLIDQNGIDLVILDLMMPKVSGWEVLESLKERRRSHGLPVIVLSAVTSEEAKLRAFDLGAVDYVVKPFAVGELLARVTRTLHEKKEKQVLAEFSITDWVTGLFNRRYLELRLPQEVSRSHRYGRALSAVFFEIDQLPWLLDEKGPQFVDGLIQQVATVVRGQTRACDVIFRYDGDYFIVLLPDTALAGGVRVADRIRVGMLETSWHGEVTLSATLGVVELAEGEDAASFLARAEEALLYAKRVAGGNALWPTPEDVGLETTVPYGFAEPAESSAHDQHQAGERPAAQYTEAALGGVRSAEESGAEAATEAAYPEAYPLEAGIDAGVADAGEASYAAYQVSPQPSGAEPESQGAYSFTEPGSGAMPSSSEPGIEAMSSSAEAIPPTTTGAAGGLSHNVAVQGGDEAGFSPAANQFQSLPTQHIDPSWLAAVQQNSASETSEAPTGEERYEQGLAGGLPGSPQEN